jgi:CRISPR/Cas system-associated exonuclease Cas4 (RecB family)
MRELVNVFSYSHSRGDLFRSCPRRYWFVRYGSWGGWNRDADPVTREIYRLTKLSNRYLWTGHHVHETVRELIETLLSGLPLPSSEKVKGDLLSIFRTEFARSKKDRSGEKPVRKGFFGLLEHDSRAFSIPDSEWKPTVDRALESVDGFYRSWVLPEIEALGRESFLDRDEELRTGTLSVDGRNVPVHLKIDLAYRNDRGLVNVLDWKTGKPGGSSAHDRQLGLYAWYFEKERDVPLDSLRLGPVYLAYRPERPELFRVTREEVMALIEETRETIRAILDCVDDPDRGVARSERFPVTLKPYICRDCPFAPFCEDRPR